MSLRIAVTLCTRERPKMLAACLDSILPQLAASSHDVSLVLVENAGTPRLKTLADDLRARFPRVSIVYGLEPELGIPFARNRAVEIALEQGADWIAFMDDDEKAGHGWFEELTAAARKWEADVIHAPSHMVYPEGFPVWLRMKQFEGGRDGTIIESAATGNTLAKAWLFSREGLGLRFDPALRFSGGSDVELFGRATKQGAIIRWINGAVLFEEVPEARQSARWQVERLKRNAANSAAQLLRERGYVAALVMAFLKFGRLCAEALGTLLVLLVYCFRADKAARYRFKFRSKLAKAWGYLMPLFGLSPTPYRHVEGQ